MKARVYYGFRVAYLLFISLCFIVYFVRDGLSPSDLGMLGISLLVFGTLLFFAVRNFRRYGPEVPMGRPGPSTEQMQAAAQAGSRFYPGLVLLLGVLGLAVLYWSLRSGHFNVFGVILTPILFLVGLGSVIHPPIFYALRRDVPGIAGGTRAMAYFLAVLGLAIGLFADWWLMHPR